MNWTGGRLQRSKNTNKGIIQKKKAHFARARTQSHKDTPAIQSSLSCGDPPFTSRTVCHTGHRRTSQNHDGSTNCSPVCRSRPETQDGAKRKLLHVQTDTAASRDTTNRYHRDRGKRPATNDAEENLLEARRKKLLQQSDWASVVRPRARTIDFKVQNRGMMGKRHALHARKGHSRPVPRPLQTQTSHQDPRRNMDGTHQNHDIRIRIGTDALTNMTPMQPQAAVTSYDTQSESMLNNADIRLTSTPGQQVDQTPCGFVGVHTHSRPPTQEPSLRSQQRTEGSTDGICSIRPEAAVAMSGNRSQPKSSGRLFSTDNVSSSGRSEGLYRNIMHSHGGDARPWRLTLDAIPDSPTATGRLMNNESRGIVIGEMNHGHDVANASVLQSGGGREESGARHPHSVNDLFWRKFWPTRKGSSSASLTAAEDPPDINLDHDGAVVDPSLACAEHAPWSQQATKGGQTLVDAPNCVSSSLPSIVREKNEDQAQKWPYMGNRKFGRRRQEQVVENDKFWQRLVFGSDGIESAESLPDVHAGRAWDTKKVVQVGGRRSKIVDDCETHPRATHRQEDGKVRTENRVSSSVAVLLSSTTYDRLFSPGSCVSDCAQDAITRAPLATSSGSTMLPTTTSPTVELTGRGQAREASKDSSEHMGLHQSEDGRVGLQPVSHDLVKPTCPTAFVAKNSQISGDPARARQIGRGLQGGCVYEHFETWRVASEARTSIYGQVNEL